ncbi:MAG: hypothetical protein ACL7BU_06450 [Candidatus Phlomobacter fragariae]
MHWKERREIDHVEDRRNKTEAQEEYSSLEEALWRLKKPGK